MTFYLDYLLKKKNLGAPYVSDEKIIKLYNLMHYHIQYVICRKSQVSLRNLLYNVGFYYFIFIFFFYNNL